MREYTTRDGDTVDEIAWRAYGRTDDQVLQALLEANQFIADGGAVLAPGIVVIIPDVDTGADVGGVRLWD